MAASKRILVSNDDGINHPALWELVRAISGLGEVIVSAPDRNCSGVGTAMTLHNPVRASEVQPLVEGVRAFAVQGMPGDAVVVGLRELAGGPVDAVITGINPGNNVTTNVLVSGTLGAAYAGHLNGVPAMAVSVGHRVDPAEPVLRRAIRAATETLLEHTGPALVNLNFPWADDWPLKGARITYPAPRILEDKTRPDVSGEDRFYWIYRELVEGVDFASLPEDCDVAALRAGFVSLNSMAWPADEKRDAPLLGRIAAAIDSAIR
ncbi:MAG: 5'/3'-nucleotidase SurE [Chloroflexi bacterium]|nr:5'/3'-nucleotidase SurE [Chloroflexota bacterium]MDA1296384.1 5'/3'-nucleotidase SurE [Chloroflexota bacterium]